MELSGRYKVVYAALQSLDDKSEIGEGHSAGAVYREGLKAEHDARTNPGIWFPDQKETRRILDALADREKIFRVIGADDEKGSVIVGRFTTGDWGEF